MRLIPLFEATKGEIQAIVDKAAIAWDKQDLIYNKRETGDDPEDDGTPNPFSICTNCAVWLKRKYFPKAKIMGYTIEENPTAEIGQDTLSGHDFLVLDDRWIIDFWYSLYRGKPNAPSLVDIQNDKKLLKKYYGDPSKWSETEYSPDDSYRLDENEENTDIKSLVDAAHKAYIKKENSSHDARSGNPFSTCTYGAGWLKKKFFPKAKIMGYHAEDNPDAEIGQDEGGHDFLVIDNRYIVDFWYNSMVDPTAPVLFDMKKGEKSTKKYYGDPSSWEEVK